MGGRRSLGPPEWAAPAERGSGGRLLQPSGLPGRAKGPAGSRLRLLKSRPPDPPPARPKAFGFRPGAAPPPPKKILLYKQGPLFSSSAHYFSAVKIYSPETRQRRISPLTASAFNIPRAFSSAVFPSLSVILAPPGRITSASHEAGTFILRV